MNYVVGIVLALATCGAGLWLPRHRDRWFYPTMVVVVVLFDVGFAFVGGDRNALLFEIAILLGYTVIALWSYRCSLWLAAAALAMHGVFDMTHSLLFENGGIPRWWPGFCMAFDVIAALFLSVLLVRRAQMLSTRLGIEHYS